MNSLESVCFGRVAIRGDLVHFTQIIAEIVTQRERVPFFDQSPHLLANVAWMRYGNLSVPLLSFRSKISSPALHWLFATGVAEAPTGGVSFTDGGDVSNGTIM